MSRVADIDNNTSDMTWMCMFTRWCCDNSSTPPELKRRKQTSPRCQPASNWLSGVSSKRRGALTRKFRFATQSLVLDVGTGSETISFGHRRQKHIFEQIWTTEKSGRRKHSERKITATQGQQLVYEPHLAFAGHRRGRQQRFLVQERHVLIGVVLVSLLVAFSRRLSRAGRCAVLSRLNSYVLRRAVLSSLLFAWRLWQRPQRLFSWSSRWWDEIPTA